MFHYNGFPSRCKPKSAAARRRRKRRAHGGGKLPPSGGGESRCSPAGTPFPRRGGKLPPTAAGRAGVHRREQKGTGHHMVSCPLLTPLTFLCAATPFGRAAKRGLRGLGSVRRFAFGTLLCPEFPLRSSPRITVRGHSVQGGGGTLRKALLRSMVYSWSTRRPCGPLAFRRATEGSRVQRKMRGS